METNENEEFFGTENDTEADLSEDDALTLDDLGPAGYIGAPAVGGPAVSFTVKKIVKLEGDKLIGKRKSDNKTFKKNLSGVDFGYEIHTSDNQIFGLSSWEVFGKLKSIFQKLGYIDGAQVEITHLLDGMKPENKDKDKYKVAAKINGSYKELDRETKNWK